MSRFYRKAIYLLCAAHKWLKKRKTNISPFLLLEPLAHLRMEIMRRGERRREER